MASAVCMKMERSPRCRQQQHGFLTLESWRTSKTVTLMTPQLLCFPSPTKARLVLKSHSRFYFKYIGKAIVCCSILKYRILWYGHILYIRLHVSDSTSLFISTPKGENILERNNSYNKTPLSILPVHAHVVTSWRSWQPGSAQRGRMGCCSMLCRSDLRSHPIFHWWQGLLDSRVKLELESMAWSRYCDLMVMHIYI